MEYFPRIFHCIMNLAATNEEFHSVLTRLEQALKEKEELKKMKNSTLAAIKKYIF